MTEVTDWGHPSSQVIMLEMSQHGISIRIINGIKTEFIL